MNALHTIKTALKSNTLRIALVGLTALSVVGPGVAFADGPEHGESHHDMRAKFKSMTPEQRQAFRAKHSAKRMERLTQKLELSEAQTKDVAKLMDARQAEVQEARRLNEGDRKAKRKAIKQIKRAYHGEMVKVLTEDQQVKFKAMVKKHKKRRFAKMSKALALTDAQKTQAKALHTQRRAQAKALIAQADGDRESVRPQLKALRKSSKADFLKLLTPEQQTKLKSMHAAKHGDKK